jgi:predicted lipoprotein
MIDKHEAILATNPTVTVICGDVAYDKDNNVVTYNEATVQAYIDANAYKDLRQAEYPSIVDQLDTLYHSGLDAWKAQIKTVKDKFPKV